LLCEQLREWSIDISSGTLDALLSADQDAFHTEKDGLLNTALATARYVTVDDSGARHRGQNGIVTHIGNADFAWFASMGSKSRINFLHLLCAGDIKYRINEAACNEDHREDIAKCTGLYPANSAVVESLSHYQLNDVGVMRSLAVDRVTVID